MNSSTQAAPKDINLDDLLAPVLSDFQKAALAGAASRPVRLSSEAVLDAAKAATGLHDFGNPDFFERLDVWAKAAAADTGLSAIGRAGIFSEMVRLASNRLQVEAALKQHPEILDIVLEPPLVIAGLPRSGTTFLLQVLAGDTRLRNLAYWEAVRPVQAPFMKDGQDQRYALCAASWEQRDRMLPHSRAIHELSPDHISEDVELHAIDFGSYYLEWLCRAPAWRDYFLAHDHTPRYRYMVKVLQLMSWQRGPRRWLLKCPQHMEKLPAINAALTNPSIVILHRDPVASIQSAITALAYSARVTRTAVDSKVLLAYWTDRYERLLRACVRDRDTLPAERSGDIYFHELMNDPLAVIRSIYAKTDLPFDEPTRKAIEAKLAENARGKHGRITYDLRKNFGVEPEVLRERFAFYYERFPNVKIEVR